MTRSNWIVLAALAALSVAGCKVETGGSSSTGSTTKSSNGKLRIVFIPKATGISYFDEVDRGFKDGCADLGCDFTSVGPAKADATLQLETVKEQIQRGVDVIAISADNPDVLVPALDDAKAKGILVITVDADLTNNEGHRVVSVLAPGNEEVGKSQLETLASQINDEGEFAILSATRDAPNQNAWIAAMKAALSDPKYSKMKLDEVVYGNDDADKSATETEGLFSKYPHLRGIISPTSAGLPAAAQSLEIAGLYPGGPHAVGGGIVLTGLATPNQMRKFVEKGVVAKFQLWSPHDMGLIACYLASGIKKGTIKPDEGTEFDVPKLGKEKIGPKGVVAAGPLVTFDKSNISQFNF